VNAIKDVYFLRADLLAEQLAAGKVSQVQALKHLVFSCILGMTGYSVPIHINFESEEVRGMSLIGHILGFIVSAAIVYYGVWFTFQANQKGDGQDYFLRFSALTLPVSVRLLLEYIAVALLLALGTAIMTRFIGSSAAYIASFWPFVLDTAFLILYFLRMRNHLARASGCSR
jgi:putative flippase GtrA